MIPLAWCRMSLERIIGTRNFPTTIVTLSLQLWNLTGTAPEVRHEATYRVPGSSMNLPKGHEWACWKEMEFGSTTTDASWTNTQAKQGCDCQFHHHKDIWPLQVVDSHNSTFFKTLNHSVPGLFIASFYCSTFVQSVLCSIHCFCLTVQCSITQCIFCSSNCNCILGILILLLTCRNQPAVNKHHTPDGAFFVLV